MIAGPYYDVSSHHVEIIAPELRSTGLVDIRGSDGTQARILGSQVELHGDLVVLFPSSEQRIVLQGNQSLVVAGNMSLTAEDNSPGTLTMEGSHIVVSGIIEIAAPVYAPFGLDGCGISGGMVNIFGELVAVSPSVETREVACKRKVGRATQPMVHRAAWS